MTLKSRLALAVGLVALAGAWLHPATARAGRRILAAQDLGTLEGDNTQGIALNDRGQIVGVTGSGPTLSSFLWEAAGVTNLGLVTVVDINNAGQILLQQVAGNPDDPTRCFLRGADGSLIELNTDAASQCFGTDLNDRGQVVGSATNTTGSLRTTGGFLWEAGAGGAGTYEATVGTLTDLGTLGGNAVLPWAINEIGQVVGSAEVPSGHEHAFLWQNGTMTDLGTPGGTWSRAGAINNRGQVAVASGAHVYVLEGDSITDLGTMGGPDVPQQVSFPLDINERGQILIAAYDIPSGQYRWGIWSAGRLTALPTIGRGTPIANRLNELGQAIGADHVLSEPTRHMVLWTQAVVRGKRAR
jgi:probable HAF family extracellular repeat protein